MTSTTPALGGAGERACAQQQRRERIAELGLHVRVAHRARSGILADDKPKQHSGVRIRRYAIERAAGAVVDRRDAHATAPTRPAVRVIEHSPIASVTANLCSRSARCKSPDT